MNFASVQRGKLALDQYGLDPTIELSMAMAQTIGREGYFIGEGGPQGELNAILAYLGFVGTKAAYGKKIGYKNYKFPLQVPFVNEGIKSLYFKVKTKTEDVLDVVLKAPNYLYEKNLLKGPTRLTAQGLLINPAIRGEKMVAGEIEKAFSLSERYKLDKFTKLVSVLPEPMKKIFYSNLQQTANDAKRIVNLFPEDLKIIIDDKEQSVRKFIEDKIRLTLGESTGINAIYSAQLAAQANASHVKASSILNLKTDFLAKIENQKFNEERAVAFSKAYESIDKLILDITEQGVDVSQQALSSLEILANSYRKSSEHLNRKTREIAEGDLIKAQGDLEYYLKNQIVFWLSV